MNNKLCTCSIINTHVFREMTCEIYNQIRSYQTHFTYIVGLPWCLCEGTSYSPVNSFDDLICHCVVFELTQQYNKHDTQSIWPLPWLKLIILIRFETCNAFYYLNHVRNRSWNQPRQSNNGTVSCIMIYNYFPHNLNIYNIQTYKRDVRTSTRIHV